MQFPEKDLKGFLIRFVVAILFLISTPLEIVAFHIVGGEIEMIHIQGFTYTINVIQYFDRSQQTNPGPEAQIFVFTYRNSDQNLMRIDTLSRSSQELLLYTNPDCAISQVQIEKVVFSREITLDPEQFSDPQGYLMVWERCCRNSEIVNIINSTTTGISYTLEFPPIVQNSEPFINSTPSLSSITSDYVCIGQFFHMDLSGLDPDGDSLVYSLIIPFGSSSTVALPVPQYPAPEREVVWADGIDDQNMIPRDPALNIDATGSISLVANNPGLYVLAAMIEEYRKGIRIGRVRREFELLVVDDCETGNAPMLAVTLPDGSPYNPGTILNYQIDEAICLNLLIDDIDISEIITLKALGVNFDQEVREVFSSSFGQINEENGDLMVELCLPDCPYLRNEVFSIDIVAMDDTCPLRLTDTVRVSFEVEAPELDELDAVVVPVGQKSCPTPDGSAEILEISVNAVFDDKDNFDFRWYRREPTHDVFVGNTVTFENRTAGNYLLSIRSKSEFCLAKEIQFVIEDETQVPKVTILERIEDCDRFQRGRVTVAVNGVLGSTETHTFEWFIADTDIPLAFSGPTAENLRNANRYIVFVTDKQTGCRSFTDFRMTRGCITSVEVEEIAVSFYPNPSKDIVHIRSPFVITEMKVLNSVGALISEESFQGTYSSTIDISTFYDGIYFIEIAGKDQKIINRVVKN